MELVASRTVRRPASDVFAFIADASNNPSWQSGMVSCRWTSPPPIAIGSRYEQVARFMGRPVVSTFVVVDLEPGRMIQLKTIDSTFPIEVRRSVEPIDDASCAVSARITGGPEGWMRFLAPLMRRRAQRSVDADYDRLVELLETK